MKKLFLLIIAVCMYLLPASAQQTVAVMLDIQKKSVLSIQGTTNIAPFRLYQNSDKFIPKNLLITASKVRNKLFIHENKITVPVNQFSSNNKMALRDFFKLMKSDTYPDLQIKLDFIELTQSNSLPQGNAIVDVTITGITKKYSFPIQTRKEGNNYLFNIRKDINIHDFRLTPPKQILGMIKVNEWINIDLSMTCNIQAINQAELYSDNL